MPEALAVSFLILISLAVFIWARTKGKEPIFECPKEEFARMQLRRDTLAERLAKAEKENWGSDMKQRLEEELAATELALARSGTR